MEPIELRIRLDTDKGTLKASRALTLGNTYSVTFDGKEGECSLYLLRCRDGKTVAASTTDFMLAVNTQEAIDLFPKDSKCPSETFVHAYVTYDGNVIAAGDVIIRYSPIAFTAAGLPVTMQGEKGEKGERGKSVFEEWLEHNPDGTWGQFMQSIKGARGEDGRDAAVIKTSGLYAFSVPDENLLMHVPDLRTFYYTDPLTGDVDTTRPKWAISESGHLLHNVYTDEGKTVVLDLGKVRGETGTGAFEAWLERNPEGSFEEFLATIKGEKGDQGEPGAPGLSESGVREIVEGYSYAKATDLLAYVKTADADAKYALAETLAKVAKDLEGKQDTLTFDDKTVPESQNPVTSGGLHSQFQQVEAWIADLVARIDGCYARVTAVMAFRGVVATVDDLPDAGANLTGDVWTVSADGAEYVWNGSEWEYLGRVIDLSAYATKEEVDFLKRVTESNGHHISSVEERIIANDNHLLWLDQQVVAAGEAASSAASAAATAQSGVDSLTAIVNELVGKTDTFEAHIQDKNNPHETTAEQVGALPITGGVVNGDVEINGFLDVKPNWESAPDRHYAIDALSIRTAELTPPKGFYEILINGGIRTPSAYIDSIYTYDICSPDGLNIGISSPAKFYFPITVPDLTVGNEHDPGGNVATFYGDIAVNDGAIEINGDGQVFDEGGAYYALYIPTGDALIGGDILIGEAQKSVVGAVSAINAHTARRDNPHGVTAEQIGALSKDGGEVAGTLDVLGDVLVGDDAHSVVGAVSAINAHIADKSNPHAVTAEQVGALPAFVNDNASKYEGSKYVNEDYTFLKYLNSYQVNARHLLKTNRVMLLPSYSNDEGASVNNSFPVINGGERLQYFDIGRGVDSPNTTYANVTYDFIFRRGVQALAGIDVAGDATFNGKVTASSITNGTDITDVFATLRHQEETLTSLIQSTIPNLQDAVAALQSTIASLQERIAALEAANA